MSKEIPLKLISGAARCKENVVYELPQSDLNFIDTIRNMRPNALVGLIFDDLGWCTRKNSSVLCNSLTNADACQDQPGCKYTAAVAKTDTDEARPATCTNACTGLNEQECSANEACTLLNDGISFKMKTDNNGNLYFNSAKDPFPIYAIPNVPMRLHFDASYCSYYPAGDLFPQPIAVGSKRSPGPQSLVFTLTGQPMIPEFKCSNPFTGSENDCNKWSGQCTWRGKPDGCVGGSAYAPYYKWPPPADISMTISRGTIGVNSCGINQNKLAGCRARLLSGYNVIDNTPGTCDTVEMNLAKCEAQLKRLPAFLYACMSDNYSGGCIQCPPGEVCAKVTYNSPNCFNQCGVGIK